MMLKRSGKTDRVRPQGTGESGLDRPLTRSEFRDYMTDDYYDFVTKIICKHFNVPFPKQVTFSDRNQTSGYYKPSKECIYCSAPWTGLYIHELAHHVVHKQGKKGTGHHNKQFWEVLQKSIYLIYPEKEPEPVLVTTETDSKFWAQFNF